MLSKIFKKKQEEKSTQVIQDKNRDNLKKLYMDQRENLSHMLNVVETMLVSQETDFYYIAQFKYIIERE